MATIAVFSLTAASAQIVSSSSRSLTVVTEQKEKKEKKEREHTGNLYIAYELPAYKLDGESFDDLKGVAVGYTKGIKLTKNMPLFLTLGISLNYARYNEEYEYVPEGEYYSSFYNRFFALSAAIPVGVSYSFQLSKTIAVVPSFGLNMRVGGLAEYKEGIDIYEDSRGYSWVDSEYYYYDYYADENSNRFTLGIYAGGNIEIKRLALGVYYIQDFMPIVDDGAKYSALSIRLGLKL